MEDRKVSIQKGKVRERIRELTKYAGKMLNEINYTSLSEQEKIPYRTRAAEILALEELLKGTNLDAWLEDCIEKEHYSGAEGIKKVQEWLTQTKPQ